jgi:hypothetical protein
MAAGPDGGAAMDGATPSAAADRPARQQRREPPLLRPLLGTVLGLIVWFLVTQIDAKERDRAAHWLDHEIRAPVAKVDPFAMRDHFQRRLEDCTYGTREALFLGCNRDARARQARMPALPDVRRCRQPDGSYDAGCLTREHERWRSEERTRDMWRQLNPLLGVPDAVLSTLWMLVTSGWLPLLLVGPSSLAVLAIGIGWLSRRDSGPYFLHPGAWAAFFLACGLVSWLIQGLIIAVILIVEGVLWAAVVAGAAFGAWSQVKEAAGFAEFFRRRAAAGGGTP